MLITIQNYSLLFWLSKFFPEFHFAERCEGADPSDSQRDKQAFALDNYNRD